MVGQWNWMIKLGLKTLMGTLGILESITQCPILENNQEEPYDTEMLVIFLLIFTSHLFF